MVLNHAKDITADFGAPRVRDCVLTVPSFFTQHERLAFLDAAELADLNVLALIDENTAAALNFGMDRIDETPVTVMFYNMGAGALQVSIVRYGSYERKEGKFDKKGKLVGSFEVLGKGWDATLGGASFDNRLAEFMAAEYQEQRVAKGVTKDVRENMKAMTKLRLQANKAKHVLSANSDTPIYMEGLADDIGYQTHISRAKFEEISHDLLLEAMAPVAMALKSANLTMEDIDMIEMLGGGMRVPKIQEELREMSGMDLGHHINSDESMALGAAFHGANVSTAFRVRHIGMTDVNPFPISVGLEDMVIEEQEGGILGGLFGKDAKKEGGDEEEKWSKSATVFKEFGKVGVKKTIAFTHDQEVNCRIDYIESEYLPKGTEMSIERYNITGVTAFAKEMAEKELGTPKVSLQFELSSSGVTKLIKAEAAVEEIVQVEVDEEYEVDVDPAEEAVEAAATEAAAKETAADESVAPKEDSAEESEAPKEDSATESEAPKEESSEEKKEEVEEDESKTGEEKKEDTTEEKKDKADSAKKNETSKVKTPKKKKMTRKVMKDKKKTHKRTLTITSYHISDVTPYSGELMQESRDKLAHLARVDEERKKLEEIKNRVESYMYFIKNKLIDDEESIGKVTTEEQRELVSKLAADAEDWMYEDGYDADFTTYSEKYVEISEPMEDILFRVKEMTARPEAIKAIRNKLVKAEEVLKKWETEKPQVTEEERASVTEKAEVIEKWISDMEEKQAATAPHEKPAFESKDVPLQTKEIEKMMKKLSKKPKPKPPKKNETEIEGEKNETETVDIKTDEDKKEEATEEETKEEVKEEEKEGMTEEEKKEKDIEDEL